MHKALVLNDIYRAFFALRVSVRGVEIADCERRIGPIYFKSSFFAACGTFFLSTQTFWSSHDLWTWTSRAECSATSTALFFTHIGKIQALAHIVFLTSESDTITVLLARNIGQCTFEFDVRIERIELGALETLGETKEHRHFYTGFLR